MTSPRPHPSGASSVLAFISFLSSFRTFLASLAPLLAARAEPSLCSRRRGPAARRGRPPSTLQTRFHPAGQSARRGPGPGRPRPGTGHAVKPPPPTPSTFARSRGQRTRAPRRPRGRSGAKQGWGGPARGPGAGQGDGHRAEGGRSGPEVCLGLTGRGGGSLREVSWRAGLMLGARGARGAAGWVASGPSLSGGSFTPGSALCETDGRAGTRTAGPGPLARLPAPLSR